MRRVLQVHKFSATGNTFVLLDLRKPKNKRVSASALPALARRLSAEFNSDGLLAISGSVRLIFFNPDGSRAFCGNGTRTAGFYETRHVLKKIKGAVDVMTDDGSILVSVDRDRAALAKASLPRLLAPNSLELDFGATQGARGAGRLEFYKVDAGCPHAVAFVGSAAAQDVAGLGARVRYHDFFKPRGTNVDFVEITGPDSLKIRTYERGVERETKSCGSGVMASVFAAQSLGKIRAGAVRVETQGGPMTVRFNGKSLALEGKVEEIFEGVAYLC
ncbi:MAG: diaminopimelate epimerase [Elusimicrobia bacterium]|nr:diaminopimelate epimerase [Elusimicrobiota bacterium]